MFYQGERSGEQLLADLALHFFQYETGDLLFSRDLIEGAITKQSTIQTIVEQFAPEWPYAKISLVDRAVLSLGIFEMLYVPDVPDVVVINEAIELAKKFGDEASPKFVNGVLNNVMRHRDTFVSSEPSV